MDWSMIVNIVLGLITLLFGSKLVKARKAIKEIVDVFKAVQDVLDDTQGETDAEKVKDIKKLATETKEALTAVKALFKIK